MMIRDRIQEFRRVPAGELRPNPRNWRVHGPAQRAALQGVLAEIGYAQALLARRRPDGGLELIDGHLRAETTPDQEVPVLVLDVDEQEAKKLLSTLDPLSAMAETDQEQLSRLAAELDWENEAVRKLIDDLLPAIDEPSSHAPAMLERLYQVVVECENESQQRDVFERMSAEGLRCRVLTL